MGIVLDILRQLEWIELLVPTGRDRPVELTRGRLVTCTETDRGIRLDRLRAVVRAHARHERVLLSGLARLLGEGTGWTPGSESDRSDLPDTGKGWPVSDADPRDWSFRRQKNKATRNLVITALGASVVWPILS